MTEPIQAAPTPGPSAEREPQTAVVPLNTIAPEDLGAGAAAFDAWLRKISHDYVTLERLTAVAGSVPVIGNIMALIDAIMDVVRVVDKRLKNQAADFLDWVSLGINLIGVIPLPPSMGAARMSLRPALHLVRQQLKQGVKNLGEALVVVLVTHLNDKIAGEIETFVEGAMSRLSGILQECAKTTDGIADDLIDILQRCIGNKPLFDLNPPAAAETKLHDAKTESRWNRMLGAMVRLQKRTANYAAAKVTNRLPESAKAGVTLVIAGLTDIKTTFRTALVSLANESTERSIQWLLRRLLDAVRRHKKPRSVMVPGHKGVQVTQDKPGHTLEATSRQAPARKDGRACKLCPAPGSTKRSISFATGVESFTHTDFVLSAPLPIEWSRTYRSDLGAFDQGPLGARWLTRYCTRVDVRGQGKKRSLVYHGPDGRSHDYAWLEVGQSHRDPVEEITLTRVSASLLLLDFGKPVPEGQPSPWRETYELVDTVPAKAELQGPQHFRLIALHTSNGTGIGLRYDHVLSDGPYAGEQVLSDILSKQADQTLAHVGVLPDFQTGRIRALWEIKDGQLVRQLAAYEHNEQGDLVRGQDENLAAWHYQYQHHLVTRYTDRTGRGMNLAYNGTDAKAKAVREWADDGSFDTRLEWDRNIRLTYVTDALGQETRYYYDIDGYTYRVVHADLQEEWFFRDDAKNVTRHIHPDGSTDDYRYDGLGNLVQHVRADGNRVHFEYNQASRLTGVMDPDGGVWKRDYDLQGRLSEETDPLGHKTQYGYDKAGRLTKVTDAKGGTKKLAYSDGGQLVRYTDCSGRTSQWAYDERGRMLKSIDAAGHETGYRYTAVTAEALQKAHQPEAPGNHPGQLEAIIRPDGNEEQLRHDAEGRLLAHTDASQRTTAYRYTAAGLIQERIDALGQRLGYQWDKLGRLTELRNENAQPYRFDYDPVGRLLQETGFDGRSTEYRYEEATGVLAAVVDGELRTELEFDPMGGLLKRKATMPGRNEQVETFSYYPGGQLGEARNDHARLQWFYDATGNLVREHHHYQGEFSPEKRTAVWLHRYDELNQRVGTTRPDGHTLEWLTYGSGHVHGLVLDGQDVVSFERDALHREVYRLQRNGLQQQQRFDPVGRLLEQELGHHEQRAPINLEATYQNTQHSPVGAAAAIVRRYRYKAGRLDNIEDSRRGRLEYRYDPVGRLLQATSAWARETFDFDPAGNIAALNQQEDARSPSPQPTLSRVLDNLLKEYAGTTYRYDERGNLIERLHFGQRSVFEWDTLNRMTKAVTPEGVTRFAYDPLGRRIAKRSERHNPHGGQPLREDILFGWDGDTLGFESRVPQGQHPGVAQTVHYIHEPGGFVPLLQARRSQSILLKPTTDVKALMAANGGRYQQELDPLWNGELDHQQASPFTKEEVAFYQCDHLGTPQELTDHEGKVAWAAQYKAWGQAKETISDAARKAGFTNPIRFQGQYLDEETGLHYNRHRYYDPHDGRFVSKDPIGLLGGFNTHAYAPNPVEWVDPLGLAPKKGSPAGKGSSCPPCDPCTGRDPASVARSWQGTSPYDGVDSYKNVVVKKGTVFYTLYPHGPAPGNYLVKSDAVLAARTAREYNDSVQVAHTGNWDSPKARDMRTQVHAYTLTEDTCMAVGTASANPHLGAGGATQYFIENRDKANLADTGRIASYRK